MTLFGILVIPLGLVHIGLVISQPIVVGAWGTFCLLAALIMLPMIPLECDEVIAMGQHLARARRTGTSLWTAFWKGGPAEDASSPDERTPALADLPERPGAVLGASLWGMSVSWTLALSTALGVCVMALPASLAVAGGAADVLHLAGALIVVVSVVSMGEVIRGLRLLDVPLGLLVAGAPWIASGAPPAARAICVLVGVAVVALAVRRGPVLERYGSWDRWIK